MYGNQVPQQQAPSQEGGDVAALLHQMRVESVQRDDQMVELRRALETARRENGDLRNLVTDSIARQDNRIDSLATGGQAPDPWNSQGWMQGYGGSPQQPPSPKSEALTKEQVEQLLEQKLKGQSQPSAEQQQRQYQEWVQDGNRLWNKFTVTYPDHARDPVFCERLKNNWAAAVALNQRAADPLPTDALYNNVVTLLVASKQKEDAIVQQQYQQQYQQHSPQPVGPNAVRPPGVGHEQYGVPNPYGMAPPFAQAAAAPYGNYPQTGLQAPSPYEAPPAPMGTWPTGPATMGAPQKVPHGQSQQARPQAQSVMPYAQAGGMYAPPQPAQQADAHFGGMNERHMELQARKARKPMPGFQ